MTNILQDIRYSVRLLARSPGFTLAAIAVLALGLGANVAIFSLVNAVLLRQLPFRDPERLVWIWSTRTDRDKAFFSIPDFIDYRGQTQTLDQIVAFANWGVNLTGSASRPGEPERLIGVRVTANALQMLGVVPTAGRSLGPGDGKPASERVVTITHGLWLRRFGGDPRLIGDRIALNGYSYTVVGVLPPAFVFPGAAPEVIIPLVPETDERRSERGSNFLRVFARLKPGVAAGQAQSEFAAITRRLRDLYPLTNAKKTDPRVLPLAEEIIGSYRAALLMLLGSVALVLLVACFNLANLLLARAAARRKEMALRAALGGTPLRLARQLLTESLLLVAAGGAVGLLLAWWGLPLLVRLSPSDLPRAAEIALDGRVLAFAFAASLVAGVLFGLAPAWQCSRVDLADELKFGRGSSGGGSRTRLRSALVVSEVALSLALLIGAGLLLKSFHRLQAVSPGVEAGHLLAVQLSLPPARYPRRELLADFYEKISRRIRDLPGVRAVAATSVLPLSGMNNRTDFTIAGRPPLTPQEMPAAQNRLVSPGYFRTMGIPVLKGREFDDRDTAKSAGVVLVDDALARRFFGAENPVGSHLRLIYDGPDAAIPVEIVGVVGNVKHNSLTDEPTATLYAPLAQIPQPSVAFLVNSLSLVVRTSSDPLALADAIRREVQAVDKDVASSAVKTMEQSLAVSLAPRRFNLLLLAVFAGAALLLAASGLYGVISYSVAQRSREIGIRLALGARRSDVMKLVLGQGFKLVFIGGVLGAAGALGLGRLASSLLFAISPADPATFAAMSLLLAVVALLAIYVPARRATRLDPAITMRAE